VILVQQDPQARMALTEHKVQKEIQAIQGHKDRQD
jgi:hypothetical protein